jgi:hypothetical protein
MSMGFKVKELRSLIFMAAAAAVLLMVLVSLINSANSARRQAADPEEASSNGAGKEPGELPVPGRPTPTKVERVPDPGDDEEETPSAPAPFKEDPGWDEGVIDRTEDLEDRAFVYLLHKAAVTPEEDLARAAEVTLDSIVALRNAKALRGKTVKIQGTLIWLQPKEIPSNASGIRTAYEGQMLDIHSKVTSFYILDLPDTFENKDVIEVRGFFFKAWRYTNRQGGIVECPLVIGKTFRKIPKYIERKPLRIPGTSIDLVVGSWKVKLWELVAVLLAVVLAPFAVLLIRVERRKYREFALEQTEKRKAKVKAAVQALAPGAPGTAPGSAASPPGQPGTALPPPAPLGGPFPPLGGTPAGCGEPSPPASAAPAPEGSPPAPPSGGAAASPPPADGAGPGTAPAGPPPAPK